MQEVLRVNLNPESDLEGLRTKKMSEIPNGANGNVGHTGPGWKPESVVWVSLGVTGVARLG